MVVLMSLFVIKSGVYAYAITGSTTHHFTISGALVSKTWATPVRRTGGGGAGTGG